MKHVKEINTWDLNDTSKKEYKQDRVTMMDPTSENMHTLMLKINELTKRINKLTSK
tara:strand:+ start:702 stop:869 length:168 start_codon:yes stop_codon:yes gene_type:complete